MAYRIDIEKAPKNLEKPKCLSSTTFFEASFSRLSKGEAHFHFFYQHRNLFEISLDVFEGTEAYEFFKAASEKLLKYGLKYSHMPNKRIEKSVSKALQNYAISLAMQQESDFIIKIAEGAFKSGVYTGRQEKVKEFQKLLEI